MKLTGEGTLLRIFIGESDTIHHQSLFESIVLAARENGLAGSTVLRGVEGFGAKSRTIHSAKILRLSEDLPIIVEIVDTEEKIKIFLPVIDKLLESSGGGAMVTLEKVDVIHYSAGKNTAT
jgi:PII-like signaling protein